MVIVALLVITVGMFTGVIVLSVRDRLGRGTMSDVDVDSCLRNLGRLEAVAASGLLERRARPELDALTFAAAARLHAPMAVMSVLDHERQTFASSFGIDDSLSAAGGMPVDRAYCKYVVAFDKALRIDDSTKHPLVKHHPATISGTRSYLGVPLRSPSGHTIGSFCVADTAARTWTEADRRALEEIASRAMNLVPAGTDRRTDR